MKALKDFFRSCARDGFCGAFRIYGRSRQFDAENDEDDHAEEEIRSAELWRDLTLYQPPPPPPVPRIVRVSTSMSRDDAVSRNEDEAEDEDNVKTYFQDKRSRQASISSLVGLGLVDESDENYEDGDAYDAEQEIKYEISSSHASSDGESMVSNPLQKNVACYDLNDGPSGMQRRHEMMHHVEMPSHLHDEEKTYLPETGAADAARSQPATGAIPTSFRSRVLYRRLARPDGFNKYCNAQDSLQTAIGHNHYYVSPPSTICATENVTASMTERLLSAVPSCSYSSTAGDTISCEGRHGLESFCLPHGRASTGASISGDPASRYYFYGHEKDYDEDGSSYSSDSQQFLSSLLFQQENHPHAASFRRSFHARQLCDHPPYRQSSAPSATPSSVPSIEAQSNDDGVIRDKKTKHKKVVSHGTLTTVSTASNSF